MTQTSASVPGAAVRGVASGVLFMAFFSTLWAAIGVGGLQGWGGPWPLVLVGLIGIALLVCGISLLRVSRQMPDEVGEDSDRRGRRIGIWFGIVFATEGILIVAASAISNAIGRFDLFFPVMALIVGVHFFPLAVLFGEKVHFLAGGLLCLLAVATLLIGPQTLSVGDHPVLVQSVLIGFGAALILWGVGLKLWLEGKSLLGRSEPIEAPMK